MDEGRVVLETEETFQAELDFFSEIAEWDDPIIIHAQDSRTRQSIQLCQRPDLYHPGLPTG